MRLLGLLLLAGLLVAAAPAPSPLSRALSAAFQEFLAEGGYDPLYRRYVGIEPRVRPPAVEAAWPSSLDLRGGVLRLGWCENPPYTFRGADGRLTGLDHDLALDLAGRIGRHYGVPDLRVEWVESRVQPEPGQEQPAMYDALIASLERGDCDAGFSGLLILEGEPVASACATSRLFTSIFYTGRDGLDVGTPPDRDALADWMAVQDREFLLMSTVNPGPSATSADALAEAVRAAGGRAESRHGTIEELIEALYDGSVHFVVGDSISLGYWAAQPRFRGRNLDIPAGDTTLDLAPFTLPGKP